MAAPNVNGRLHYTGVHHKSPAYTRIQNVQKKSYVENRL